MSKRKIVCFEKVLSEVFHLTPVIASCAAPSEVSETPHDKDTMTGAKNRASYSKKMFADADMWIGLESGLIDRYGSMYEEVWCCVLTKDGKESFGYSSGLRVPDSIEKGKKEKGVSHHEYLHSLAPDSDDTWGFYSHDFINRDVGLAEAIRNACIPLFAPQESHYHK